MTPTRESGWPGVRRHLQAVCRAWNAFWHVEGSTLTLGLFRIVFACAMFLEVQTTRVKSLFAIEGGFHLPYAHVPSFIRPMPADTFHLVQTLQYPLIVLLGLGLFMRPSIVGLLALQGYVFFSDSLNFRNHPYFFLLVLVVLLVSPADESMSFKALERAGRRRAGAPGVLDALIGPARPLTAQRILMIEFGLIYILAVLQKLNPSFLNGSVLSVTLEQTRYIWGHWEMAVPGGASIRFGELLLRHDLMVAASWAVVALEFLLPLMLWFPKTRPAAFLVGIAFHLSIFLLMNIPQFSIAMIACYLLFLEPETLPGLASRLRKHR